MRKQRRGRRRRARLRRRARRSRRAVRRPAAHRIRRRGRPAPAVLAALGSTPRRRPRRSPNAAGRRSSAAARELAALRRRARRRSRPARRRGGASRASRASARARWCAASSSASRRDGATPWCSSGRCYERESVPYKALDGVVDALAARPGAPRSGRGRAAAAARGRARWPRRVPGAAPRRRRSRGCARRSPASPDPSSCARRAFGGAARAARRARRASTPARGRRSTTCSGPTPTASRCCASLLRAPSAPDAAAWCVTRRAIDGAAPGAARAPSAPSTLGRLSAEEGRALDRAARRPSRGAEADALVDDAGGHPMFLQELAPPQHRSRGHRRAFDDALWARVARMEHRARRVLELVAVAGAPVPQAVVGAGARARGAHPEQGGRQLRATVAGPRPAARAAPIRSSPITTGCARRSVARARSRGGAATTSRLAAALLGSGAVDKDPLAVVRHLEAAGADDAPPSSPSRRRGAPSRRSPSSWPPSCGGRAAARPSRRGCAPRAAACAAPRRSATRAAGPRPPSVFLAAAEGADRRDRLPVPARGRARAAGQRPRPRGPRAARRGARRDRRAACRARSARPSARSSGRWLRIACAAPASACADTPDARASAISSGSICCAARRSACGWSTCCPARASRRARCCVALRMRRSPAASPTRSRYHAMYLGSERHADRRARRAGRARPRVAAEHAARSCSAGAAPPRASSTSSPATTTARWCSSTTPRRPLRDRSVGTAAELNQLRVFMPSRCAASATTTRCATKQTEYLRDALRRGDRYAAAVVPVWSSNVVWLAAGELGARPRRPRARGLVAAPRRACTCSTGSASARAARARPLRGRSRRDARAGPRHRAVPRPRLRPRRGGLHRDPLPARPHRDRPGRRRGRPPRGPRAAPGRGPPTRARSCGSCSPPPR